MSKATKKPTLKERLQEHMAEYGALALIIFFSIFALTYLGFYIAIKTGMNVGDGAAGNSGTLFAAWVATKITLPLRIGGTFLLTPIAAAVIHKVKGKPLIVKGTPAAELVAQPSEDEASDEDASDEDASDEDASDDEGTSGGSEHSSD